MSTTTINATPAAGRLLAESLVSTLEAAKRFPPCRGDRPVSASVVRRWIIDGAETPSGEKVRLEGVRLGGRWLTTAEAIERFVEALTSAHIGGTVGG
jgi:Protein of unknown function (DUF1580)